MSLCASPTIRIAVAVLQATRDRGRFRGFSPSDPDALVPGAGNRKERGSTGSGSQEERAATRFHPVADDWLLSQLRVLTKPCSRVSSSAHACPYLCVAHSSPKPTRCHRQA